MCIYIYIYMTIYECVYMYDRNILYRLRHFVQATAGLVSKSTFAREF